MRTLPTLALGVLFVLGFSAFLLIDSVARFATDGEAFVGAAHHAGLRDSLVDATTTRVVGELERDPRLSGVDRDFVRAGVARVLSEEWFDETLRSVHRAALHGATEASRSAVLELAELKEALEGRLDALEGRAIDSCRALFGASRCADSERAKNLLVAYRQQAHRAIEDLPERIELAPDAAHINHDKLDYLLEARWIAIALLVLTLAGIALLNLSPPQRLLRSVGLTLAVAGGLFLAIALAARLTASGAIADRLLAGVELDKTAPGESGRLVTEGLRHFGAEIVIDATRDATRIAGVTGGVGLVLILVGAVGARGIRRR